MRPAPQSFDRVANPEEKISGNCINSNRLNKAPAILNKIICPISIFLIQQII